MIIEKKTVIQALLTEPLEAGMFFSSQQVKTCPVCAVGAVIRSSLGEKLTIQHRRDDLLDYCGRITDHEYIDGNVDALLAEKNYLGALSNFSEDEALMANDLNLNGPAFRKVLVQFVQDNFPESFKVENL